jgi:hypothetical protein
MIKSIPIPKFNHERFLSLIKIDSNSDCWIWNGCKAEIYGKFGIYYKSYYAHRVSYSLFNGPLTNGMVIDHTCRNKICVNPEHLREVTQQQNAVENSLGPSYFHSLKTHCPQGHEYSEENTRIRRGSRECKTCDRASAIKRYYRKKNV